MLPTSSSGLMGAAGALGLGGDLSQQVKDETEEQRKKRMMQQQQQSLGGPAGSMAVTSIFGPTGGLGA